MDANLPAAAATASTALASLLRAVPGGRLEQCSETTRALLRSFLQMYTTVSVTGYQSGKTLPETAHLTEKFFHRLAEHPSSLGATAAALQACQYN